MASIGHVAVGMAAARGYGAPRWSSMAWWSALSLVPDADVVGFPLNVEYGDPWGHRGATHSLAFASAVGLVVGLIAILPAVASDPGCADRSGAVPSDECLFVRSESGRVVRTLDTWPPAVSGSS